MWVSSWYDDVDDYGRSMILLPRYGKIATVAKLMHTGNTAEN
jgi:hypothetical protein